MKTKHILSALILLAGTSVATSCQKLINNAMQKMADTSNTFRYEDSDTRGKVVTKELPTMDFHEVELNGAVRVEYTQQNSFSLAVHGNEKAIEAYTITEDDGELHVTLKDFGGHVNADTPAITLRIAAPSLSEIKGSGITEIEFADSVRLADELDINFGGVANFRVARLEAKELDLNVSGAGIISLGDLRCQDDAEIHIEGVGSVNGKVTCGKLKLRADGSVSGKLELDTSKTSVSSFGSSHITLTGKTEYIRQEFAGASVVSTDSLEVRAKSRQLE